MCCLKEDHRWWHSARRAVFHVVAEEKKQWAWWVTLLGRFLLAETQDVEAGLAYFSGDKRIGRPLVFKKCYKLNFGRHAKKTVFPRLLISTILEGAHLLPGHFSSVFPGNFRNSLSEQNKYERKRLEEVIFHKTPEKSCTMYLWTKNNILLLSCKLYNKHTRRQAFERGELLDTIPVF